MSNLNVAILAAPDYAKDLGKKGTTSDITFYNLKKGDATVTFIEPTRYPEKLSSMFYAVSIADRVVLVVDEINASFGECVMMLQCAGDLFAFCNFQSHSVQLGYQKQSDNNSLHRSIIDNKAVHKFLCISQRIHAPSGDPQHQTEIIQIEFGLKGWLVCNISKPLFYLVF